MLALRIGRAEEPAAPLWRVCVTPEKERGGGYLEKYSTQKHTQKQTKGPYFVRSGTCASRVSRVVIAAFVARVYAPGCCSSSRVCGRGVSELGAHRPSSPTQSGS